MMSWSWQATLVLGESMQSCGVLKPRGAQPSATRRWSAPSDATTCDITNSPSRATTSSTPAG